jgi:hypothetical protein
MPTIAAESADAWPASAGTMQHFAASGSFCGIRFCSVLRHPDLQHVAASGSAAFSGIRIYSILRHPDLQHFAASGSAAFSGIRICSIFAASGSAAFLRHPDLQHFCGIRI